MQTENIYVEAYAKVCEPEIYEEEKLSREEHYEGQLKNANIPEDMLYRVYVQMKDENAEELSRLSERYLELSRAITSARTPEEKARAFYSWDRLDALDCIAYGIVSAMTIFFLTGSLYFHVDFESAMNNLHITSRLLLISIPIGVVVYFISRVVVHIHRTPTHLMEYNAKILELEEEHQEVGEKYHDLKARLNVIRRACQDKHSEANASKSKSPA